MTKFLQLNDNKMLCRKKRIYLNEKIEIEYIILYIIHINP